MEDDRGDDADYWTGPHPGWVAFQDFNHWIYPDGRCELMPFLNLHIAPRFTSSWCMVGQMEDDPS